MARNNLAHGQKWKTLGGVIVTLRSYGYRDVHPDFGTEREWFQADNGMIYCNVEVSGLKVFIERDHNFDLVERIE